MQCKYSKKPRDYLNKLDWKKNYNDIIRQIVEVLKKNRLYKLCRRFYLKLKNLITDKYKFEKNLEKPKKWLL